MTTGLGFGLEDYWPWPCMMASMTTGLGLGLVHAVLEPIPEQIARQLRTQYVDGIIGLDLEI